MPRSEKLRSREAAYRRARDPGRPTGSAKGVLDKNDPGSGGGNDWMGDVVKGSAELARRVKRLLGERGHG